MNERRISARRHAVLTAGVMGLASVLGACAGAAPTDEELGALGSVEQAWDSEEGNPTHSTHSYLTEWAVREVAKAFPEVAEHASRLIDGANTELHELPVEDDELEALRREIRGTNWSCDRPAVLFDHAKRRYAAGDKGKAYWYVGVLLHHVEDMGVPAHAFQKVHQGNLREVDNFERLALVSWEPADSTPNRTDPDLEAPDAYVAFSGRWAAQDFEAEWPGVTYRTDFFSRTWIGASDREKDFVHARQGHTAFATAWALRRAAAILTGAPERDDVVRRIVPGAGAYGDWSRFAYCPEGTWADAYRQRVEGRQGGDDDTALNAVSLRCRGPGKPTTWVTPHAGYWGDWSAPVACDGGALTGARLRIEPKQGSGDDTGANDARFVCSNGDELDASGGGPWGEWAPLTKCPAGAAVCGVSVRVEPLQGGGDDTALNGLRLACCPFGGR